MEQFYPCTLGLNPSGANTTTSKFTIATPALQSARAFLKVEENVSFFNTHKATHRVVTFYSAGVVNRSRRIVPRPEAISGTSSDVKMAPNYISKH
jgi:hypothetical protein